MKKPLTLAKARQLIAPPQGMREVLHEKGLTGHIMAEIVKAYELYKEQAATLAGYFNNSSDVHRFVRQINYVIDPEGEQVIKSPAATIFSGFGDCKAYSILIGAILANMGQNFSFRFTSYKPGDFTHVYILDEQGKPIDACLPSPYTEKEYFKKKDILIMTQISRISGPGCNCNNKARRAFNNSPMAEETWENPANCYQKARMFGPGMVLYYDQEPGHYYQNYYFEEPAAIGFLKKIFKGIKNAATWVKDKVAKPVIKLASTALEFAPIPGASAAGKLLKKVVDVGGKTLTVADKVTGAVKAIESNIPAEILNATPGTLEEKQQMALAPVTNQFIPEQPAPAKNNTMLLVGAAAAAYFLMNQKPSRRR